MTITRTALDLHTDLQNVENYAKQGNKALVTELLWAASAKIAQIQAYLDDTRQAYGAPTLRVVEG